MQVHPIRLTAPIGDHATQIRPSEVRDAVPAERELAEGLEIDLNASHVEDGAPASTPVAFNAITEAVGGYLKFAGRAHPIELAVFGFAPIPLLVTLGWAIGDKHAARVYQRRRAPETWCWGTEAPAGSDLTLHIPRRHDHPTVAVALSISGRVPPQAVDRCLGAEHVLYEIEAAQPRPDLIHTPAQLERFAALWQQCMADIRRHAGPDTVVHLFAAVPISIAVECGRRLLPKADPPIHVYDFDQGAFRFAVRLGRGLSPEVPVSIEPTSIAFIAAQPKSLARVSYGVELRSIAAELRNSLSRDRVVVGEVKLAVTTEEIQRLLREVEGDVLHFVGHGTKDGGLILETPDGASVEVSPSVFVRLLSVANRTRTQPFRLVVLNACSSGSLAKALVDEGVVPAAIGTRVSIHDRAGVAFAKGFYGALVDGVGLEAALELGRNEVLLSGAMSAGNADDFELYVADTQG